MFWIVEVFVWIMILFAVSGCLMLVKYNHKRSMNTYQIFLPDVDGLINGSPVKLMGIQIGYVNQLDIVGENVYVRFVVTEKDVKIPQGAIATVEFSGLGGSKSLELYPPTTKTEPSDKLLIAQSPKRIHDSLGLLNNMFNQLMGLAYTASNFMNEMGVINPNRKYNGVKQVKAADGFLKTSDNWLDKMQKQSDNFNNKLNNTNDKIKKNKLNGNGIRNGIENGNGTDIRKNTD